MSLVRKRLLPEIASGAYRPVAWSVVMPAPIERRRCQKGIEVYLN